MPFLKAITGCVCAVIGDLRSKVTVLSRWYDVLPFTLESVDHAHEWPFWQIALAHAILLWLFCQSFENV